MRAPPVIALVLFGFSCQSFPAGVPLEEVTRESGHSFEELHDYYTMTRSAWRVRGEYRDREWDLHYFGDEQTNALGLAIPDGSTLYIAYRGTQVVHRWIDVRMNLMVLPRSIPFAGDERMRAHRGLLEKYLGLRDELHAQVANHTPDRVVITGYSGGGVLALLTFLDLARTHPKITARVVTFGMPRGFNRYAARWFTEHETNILRVVMGRDVVPAVPPALFGYRHVGRLVRIGRRALFPPFSFADHWPGYQEELAARAARDQVAR